MPLPERVQPESCSGGKATGRPGRRACRGDLRVRRPACRLYRGGISRLRPRVTGCTSIKVGVGGSISKERASACSFLCTLLPGHGKGLFLCGKYHLHAEISSAPECPGMKKLSPPYPEYFIYRGKKQDAAGAGRYRRQKR